MSDVSPRHDPYLAFRYSNYRLFALANTFAVLGSQIQIVAIGWELWHRTHSMADLGWLGLIQAAPVITFVLPSGHVADNYSRAKIIFITQLLAALSAVGLAVLAAISMPVTGVAGAGVRHGTAPQQRDDVLSPRPQRDHPRPAAD